MNKEQLDQEYTEPDKYTISRFEVEEEVIEILRSLDRNMRRNLIGLIKEIGKLDNP